MMDGWVRVLSPFNSISVISRRWKGEHERLCAMKRRLGLGRILPPAGFEPATPWSKDGSAYRSATLMLPCLNYLKIWPWSPYHKVMCQRNGDRMANSVDPDQTAPGAVWAVWSGFTLFAKTSLSKKQRIIIVHIKQMINLLWYQGSWNNHNNLQVWAHSLNEQSDQGLHYFQFLHLFDALLHLYKAFLKLW